MADNQIFYGFRPFKSRYGSAIPQPERGFCVSGQAFNVNGGIQNANLQTGDVIRKLASGGLALCDGAEGAGGAQDPLGVVAAIEPYYNAGNARMQPSSFLPSGVVYGTNLERQSRVHYWRIDQIIWEVDCNGTLADLAAYQLTEGANVGFRLYGAAGAAVETGAKPRLDITTVNTTNTLTWRIMSVSPTQNNRDFSGQYVKLLVIPNVFQDPAVNQTGI